MPTTIRLEPDVERRLIALAARTGRTKSSLLREIIQRGLDKIAARRAAAAVPEEMSEAWSSRTRSSKFEKR
jgi:RHH-type transcriptional regulator, rel operon repressor / antitoxin RelB